MSPRNWGLVQNWGPAPGPSLKPPLVTYLLNAAIERRTSLAYQQSATDIINAGQIGTSIVS